jgi:hypothetical protein
MVGPPWSPPKISIDPTTPFCSFGLDAPNSQNGRYYALYRRLTEILDRSQTWRTATQLNTQPRGDSAKRFRLAMGTRDPHRCSEPRSCPWHAIDLDNSVCRSSPRVMKLCLSKPHHPLTAWQRPVSPMLRDFSCSLRSGLPSVAFTNYDLLSRLLQWITVSMAILKLPRCRDDCLCT